VPSGPSVAALLWIPPEMEWTITCSGEIAEALEAFGQRLGRALAAGQSSPVARSRTNE
jgi:hypothetical protein